MKTALLFSSALAFIKHVSLGEILEYEASLESTFTEFEPEIVFFEQPRDHFNKKDNHTWLQAYYVDDIYYKEGGPVLMDLTGEWSLSTNGRSSSLTTALAQKHHGIVVGLEHRYYGENGRSWPVEKLDSKTLEWLTIDQAIEDTANFIRKNNITVNGQTLSKDTKYIAVGGSYAANLAAWARLRHPEIIYAAHASSGPFLAKTEFWEYSYAVDVGLSQTGVSQTCADNWVTAVAQFDALIEEKGAAFVLEKAGAYPEFDIRDLAGFSTVFAGHVQYGYSRATITLNGELASFVDIVCSGKFFPEFMQPNQEPKVLLETYFGIIKAVFPTSDYFKGWDTNLQFVEAARDGLVNHRWTYQFCKDYGYFQVASSGPRTFYSRHVSVDYYTWYCDGILGYFGYSGPQPEAINEKYYGLDLLNKIDRIVVVNGDVDPWSYLSIMDEENVPEGNYVVTIPGATHCTDLRIPKDTSSEASKKAYDQIMTIWDEILE